MRGLSLSLLGVDEQCFVRAIIGWYVKYQSQYSACCELSSLVVCDPAMVEEYGGYICLVSEKQLLITVQCVGHDFSGFPKLCHVLL